MHSMFRAGVLALAALSVPALAETPAFDAAKAFGSREAVEDVSLSPDGTKIAYIAPTTGVGAALFTINLEASESPKRALAASGQPERLKGCGWVSGNRLVCTVYGVINKVDAQPYPFTRLFAIDADGANPKLLSNRENMNSLYFALGGGGIVDWLPGENNAVLMSRQYVPEANVGSLVKKDREGLGVDRVDTLTLSSRRIEQPRADAVEYLGDGHGKVRIMGYGLRRGETFQDSGIINYYYRKKDSDAWLEFGSYDSVNDQGFNPYAVNSDLDVVYGLMKKDGRWAAYQKSLDGSGTVTLVYARPDVDVGGFRYIGRQRRVVGVSYTTDKTYAEYFDPEMTKMKAALGKALGGKRVSIVDTSGDEKRMLLFVDADTDPGAYYLFDKTSRQMGKLLDVRPALAGQPIAAMRPIQFKAADGTMIPAYLRIPVGMEGKKVPAIVMPHGGPSARDEWGFDWLAGFYAARGYAVIQPQYRGSDGYGDEWFRNRGFKNWRVAINDVMDAGRWLVAQGIADPSKLAIVGWSYGGYAALQSGVTDPSLFKAIVAIAPVTDLNELKEEWRGFTNFRIVSDFVGSGPHIEEGSPARHADRIKAPVLLVHGEDDRNVRIAESRLMDSRLASAGVPHEFIAFPKLDHQLEDSAAREQMLRRSDEFLRKAMGM